MYFNASNPRGIFLCLVPGVPLGIMNIYRRKPLIKQSSRWFFQGDLPGRHPGLHPGLNLTWCARTTRWVTISACIWAPRRWTVTRPISRGTWIRSVARLTNRCIWCFWRRGLTITVKWNWCSLFIRKQCKSHCREQNKGYGASNNKYEYMILQPALELVFIVDGVIWGNVYRFWLWGCSKCCC